jgi:azurin
MKFTLKTALALLTALIFAIPAFASGSDDDVRTIHVKGLDNMKFDVELIEAEPGERIRIVLETVSNMPPQAMQHNLAIIDLGTDLESFSMASMQARDNDYIAPDYEDRVIANTAMIPGGETAEVVFTVPDTPGDYDYVCTWPGHFMAGMVGVLRVQ